MKKKTKKTPNYLKKKFIILGNNEYAAKNSMKVLQI